MILNAYNLIAKLQSDIGNGAQVWILIKLDCLEIRVDWSDVDFHALRSFTENELKRPNDPQIRSFVDWCKNEYATKVQRKKESGS